MTHEVIISHFRQSLKGPRRRKSSRAISDSKLSNKEKSAKKKSLRGKVAGEESKSERFVAGWLSCFCCLLVSPFN